MTKRSRTIGGGRQCGSALVVSLILLVVLTMLAVQGMRTNVLQERMAGNMRERSLAFQAAEAAMREGERLLSEGAIEAGDELLDPAAWDGLVFPTADSGQPLPNFDISLAQQPSFYVGQRLYMFDLAGDPDRIWCPHVVTAHGVGAQADTRVILQSFYRPRNCN